MWLCMHLSSLHLISFLPLQQAPSLYTWLRFNLAFHKMVDLFTDWILFFLGRLNHYYIQFYKDNGNGFTSLPIIATDSAYSHHLVHMISNDNLFTTICMIKKWQRLFTVRPTWQLSLATKRWLWHGNGHHEVTVMTVGRVVKFRHQKVTVKQQRVRVGLGLGFKGYG